MIIWWYCWWWLWWHKAFCAETKRDLPPGGSCFPADYCGYYQLLKQLPHLSSALQTTATAIARQTTATAYLTMCCPMFCLSSSLSDNSYLGRVYLRLMRRHEALMFLPSHSFTAHCCVVFLCKRMRLGTTQLGKENHITLALVEFFNSVQFLWVFANHCTIG